MRAKNLDIEEKLAVGLQKPCNGLTPACFMGHDPGVLDKVPVVHDLRHTQRQAGATHDQ